MIVILSTCDSEDQATRIARHLVEQRLAACVNIVPGIRSIYAWQGKIEDSAEWMLVIKSRRELFDAVRQEIQKLHTYDVPEVIAIPIVDGAENYLTWMAQQTTFP